MKGNVAEVSERKFRLLPQHVTLEHLTIVTSLGGYIFSGCTNLSSVAIGANVQSIGEYAFLACSLLTSIEYKGKKNNGIVLQKVIIGISTPAISPFTAPMEI